MDTISYLNWQWKNFKFFHWRPEGTVIYPGFNFYIDKFTIFSIIVDLPIERFSFRLNSRFQIFKSYVNKSEEFKGNHWVESQDDEELIHNFAKTHGIPTSDYNIERVY